jgi:hypothetical protein
MKHRTHDPSEICALECKGEFRRCETSSVSATIGINWSIFGIRRICPAVLPAMRKTPSGPLSDHVAVPNLLNPTSQQARSPLARRTRNFLTLCS